MSKKHYLILSAVGVIAVSAMIFFIYFREVKNRLEADFLDVGQGDAILIKTPYGQNILIDGGPDGKVMRRLAENLPFWDKKIDLMVLTHPHDDHVTGLLEVVKRYDVEKILYTGATHTGPNYLAWLEAVRAEKIPVTIIDRRQTIRLGDGCELEILYPGESLLGVQAANLNNTSIVMRLRYGETRFFLGGDIEAEIEGDLADSGLSLDADVFKANHHGSDTSNTERFLGKVGPDIVVVEAGRKNSFGHPSGRVLKRFERTGARVFRTDLDGTVKITSDGKQVKAAPF